MPYDNTTRRTFMSRYRASGGQKLAGFAAFKKRRKATGWHTTANRFQAQFGGIYQLN